MPVGSDASTGTRATRLACWIINNSLSIADTRSPLLRLRAQQELPQIESVKLQHASRVALVPVLASEPTGIDKLKQLAG